jgi:hypothetical protein
MRLCMALLADLKNVKYRAAADVADIHFDLFGVNLFQDKTYKKPKITSVSPYFGKPPVVRSPYLRGNL